MRPASLLAAACLCAFVAGCAGTPPAVQRKVFEATVAAMQAPGVKAALAREGTDVSLSASPEVFDQFLQEDGKFWVNLVKSAKVKVD